MKAKAAENGALLDSSAAISARTAEGLAHDEISGTEVELGSK